VSQAAFPSSRESPLTTLRSEFAVVTLRGVARPAFKLGNREDDQRTGGVNFAAFVAASAAAAFATAFFQRLWDQLYPMGLPEFLKILHCSSDKTDRVSVST
jgi:hypothetical protein